MKKIWTIAGFCVAFLPELSFAQIEENSGEISLYASVCENITNGESKSSARVRATDKASFKAVEEIPELGNFRAAMPSHEFNLKIYQLVDNHIEDIKINVIDQTKDRVCVEVNAFLASDSIDEVFGPDTQAATDKNLQTLDVEQDALIDDVNITIPPKPEITINEHIAYDSQTPADTMPVPVTQPEQSFQPSNQTTVYVDKTEFYNNTSTNGFFAHIEKEILQKEGLKAISKLNNPDYILKTKVLKAKIDNINSETGRMQIVIALELTDTSNSKTTTEHQNRFILFNTGEDTQAIASDLTKKLMSTGIAKLLPLIKSKENVEKATGAIITPH